MSESRREDALKERAVLVGLGMEEFADSEEFRALDELSELARTANVQAVARVWQRKRQPDVATWIGKGKVDEVAGLVREHEAEVVICDSELSPRQVRNLEKEIGVRVIDRSELILDIFAAHARTVESRLQVELAQLLYTRNRLTRMWSHLSRITGKAGVGSRGPGEKQLETDRRLVDHRVTMLERELAEIKARKVRQVATRRDELTISLVGYTNAGKSTLMAKLTGADVYCADQLFATLDTKTSDFELASGKRILLSDTVGFVDKLPHHLVASFHATLEEVRQAKLLLHVVDASSPDVERQIATVQRVLGDELGIKDREEIMVLNKIDRVTDPVDRSILLERHPGAVAVSAVTGAGIDLLLARLQAFDDANRSEIDLRLPVADGRTMAELQKVAEILSLDYGETEVAVRARIPNELAGLFKRFER